MKTRMHRRGPGRTVAGELIYGGTLDVDKQRVLPPALSGRGSLVGAYDNTASVVMSVYGYRAL